MKKWKNRLPLAVAVSALAVALLGAGVPTAVAHGVQHALFAHNAGKIDGRDAIGFGASANARAGKLVATNAAGKLPNSIIAKAPDADKLDGLDSSAFVQSNVELPHAKAVQTVAQSIPNNTVNASNKVTFHALELDGGLTLANNELTVTASGVYSVTGAIKWDVNGTGGRTINLTKNDVSLGAPDVVQAAPATFGITAQSVTTLVRFDAGDRIGMYVAQSSGAALNTFVISGNGASLSAHWVSP